MPFLIIGTTGEIALPDPDPDLSHDQVANTRLLTARDIPKISVGAAARRAVGPGRPGPSDGAHRPVAQWGTPPNKTCN